MTDTSTESTTPTLKFAHSNGKSYSWPVKDCSRCGGSGHYSYNSISGTTCFGCNGAGVQIKGTIASKLANEFNRARKARSEASTSDLAVGDLVQPDLSFSRGDEWVEVTAIEVTDEACVWSVAPDGTRTPVSFYHRITLADGTERRVGSQRHARKFTNGEKCALLAEYQAQLPAKVRAESAVR